MSRITLYGAPLSLYTGRARSYLIKSGISYQEVIPNTKYVVETVVPKAGGRSSMPTIELDDGEVIRDGVAIVDHFEAIAGSPFTPETPAQRIVSLLFDVIGAEGLLRTAMHYRWDFPEQNLEFIRFHFNSVMPPGPDREEKGDAVADRMRAAGGAFGAVPEAFDLIESLYHKLLGLLDTHFSENSYLLGAKPSIGDFGLIAPFYGHLGRDPAPLAIMQAKAVRMFRWVERVNRPDADVGEFGLLEEAYLPNDEIPDSLIDVLKHIAIDFVPETEAAADCINEWLETQVELAPGAPVLRGVGQGTFTIQGQEITALAQPFRFYLLKRVQKAFNTLGDKDRQVVSDLFERCEMTSLLSTQLTRDIGRKNNVEVWL